MGGPIFNQPVQGVDTGADYGVHGRSTRGGSGVYGRSDSSDGSPSKPGVYGLMPITKRTLIPLSFTFLVL